MIKTSQNVIDATTRFMQTAAPRCSWTAHNVLCMDATRQQAYHCALCAFDLYRKEWGGFDITHWQWPISELSTTGKRFEGDEPWSVLFRSAMRLLRTARKYSRAT